MAITVVGSLDSATGTALTTLTLTAAASVGDVRVLVTVLGSASINVSSISGGNCGSGWSKVAGPDSDTNGTSKRHEMWIGTVANGNTSGHETITITWSSSTAGLATDLDCRTFTNSNTATTWARDGAALTFKNNVASTTITYPTGTAAGTGELYVGHARCPAGGSYGTPSGTPSSGWVTTTDANGNPYIYNVNVGSGSVAPTQSTSSTVSYATGVLLIASSTTTWALAADGLASSSGTAAFNVQRTLAADGLASSSGTATVNRIIPLAADGLASSSGSITFTVLLAADGLAASSGTATLLVKAVLAAAGLAASAGTAVLGTIKLPDPFAVLTGAYRSPLLGCGTWRVFVATRGGMQLLAELDFESLTVGRTLSAVSTASAVVLADLNPSCAPLLASLEPFQHELVAFRDYQPGDSPAWAGPVTVPVWDPISLTIGARDLMSWFDVRNLPMDRVFTADDLADIFTVYIQDALSLDPTPNITTMFNGELGVVGDRTVTAASATIAGDALRELSRSGVDFSAVGRTVNVGGLLPTVATCTLYNGAIIQDAGGSTPTLTKQGLNLATSVTLKGGQDPAGNQLVATVGTSDGVHGLVSRTASEPLILDQLSLTKAAAGRLSFLNPAPLYLNCTLSPDAPVRFEELVPGIRMDTALQIGLMAVVGQFRLSAVNVTVSQQAGETVALTLVPMST